MKEEYQKRKDRRDILKALGISVLVIAAVAAVVIGSQQLGIR
jgi:hypothetical protein